MGRLAWRWVRRGLLAGLALLGLVFLVRAVEATFAEPLEPWHTVVPEEAPRTALDAMDWAGWLAAEARAIEQVEREVSARLTTRPPDPTNRYDPRSPVHPGRFARDWNRSFLLEPEGPPRGAVVLLHGLTDAPYSLRHLADLYRARGFVAIAPRMPGHGTVPAGLTAASWEDWAAAVRLAMREARRRAGEGAPIHLVGYSNGGALAMLHALEALAEPRLVRPDRLVLLSPMIGVTAFARFAGLAELPAFLPAFAPAAWLSRLPEFNPFKYNSFPVNAARQSHRLTQAVQLRLAEASRDGRLDRLPPVLTFQSVADSTVSTAAVIDRLYAALPAQGSELVLFDRNRAAGLETLVRPAYRPAAETLVPPAPRHWGFTLVTNATERAREAIALRTAAGGTAVTLTPLGLAFPDDIYSLSHVALPFPREDSLYGAAPEPPRAYGVSLGTLAPRGETGVLAISVEGLMRLGWNPFFPMMLRRIAADIP